MRAISDCDSCEAEFYVESDAGELPQECPECSNELDLHADDFLGRDRIENCVKCGEDDFYQVTQINPNFGMSMVVIGTLLFLGCVFFIPGMDGFLWGMVVLLTLAVFDRLLRMILPEAVICYHCSTVYQDVNPEQEFEEYDHEHAAHIKYSD